jgi:hypothetical protein
MLHRLFATCLNTFRGVDGNSQIGETQLKIRIPDISGAKVVGQLSLLLNHGPFDSTCEVLASFYDTKYYGGEQSSNGPIHYVWGLHVE